MCIRDRVAPAFASAAAVPEPGTLALAAISMIGLLVAAYRLSLIHISEPTRLLSISYAVFCLKKKNTQPHPSHSPILEANDNTYNAIHRLLSS